MGWSLILSPVHTQMHARIVPNGKRLVIYIKKRLAFM